MNVNEIILRPVISEKTTELMEKNKYVFQVPMKVNKIMVKQAVKELFGVKPESINIVRMRGKTRRVRYRYGNRPAWKKAIITLRHGDKIEVFEAQ